MDFRTEHEKREGRSPIIKLFGELDINASPDFKEEVLNVLNTYDDDIYLDFTDLDYIDSTGLGALITILKDAQEKDKKIYLREVNERIRKLFKITSLEDMFIFEGDLDE